MLKNVHGAAVGDIWQLKQSGWCFLLLEHRKYEGGYDEDSFFAVCLDTGHYDSVFFDHNVPSSSWRRVA